MGDRYYVSQPIVGDRARLVDEEAHHLAHVMRASAGDDVAVFDGSGAEWLARVARVGRAEVELELLCRREVDRELHVPLTLGVALPKGDRQRWLVEKAVELGVGRLTPLSTTRGVAQPTDKALARLRRAVIESSKQCGRNRLMEISTPVNCFDFCAAEHAAGAVRAMADPSGDQSLRTLLESPASPTATSLIFAVGPEGGFSEDEIAAAQSAGWPLIDLGARTLRVETAAIYMAAVGAALTCQARGE